ncbi:MAG: FAD-dependent monooxygenase [Ardenticatenaceae bacterium]|nr:FAD-dependent monooxygenase [Ardenticatenaceae bacterium]
MRIGIIGGGPAGLYCGLLMKKANPSYDITIVERNPPGATYGWGVVFSDRTLAEFREADIKTYTEITDHFVIWDAIDVRYRGEILRCGGHVFAGIARKRLLKILQRRCDELGVRLRFEVEVSDLADFADCDLIVAADGVNSFIRSTYAHAFKPSIKLGEAKYIWLGTNKVLDSFTFVFRENEHGLFQVHSYPFDGHTSTFIVECDEATWKRAGLDEANEAESIAYCEALFTEELLGCRLMSNNSKWINFVLVKNRSWHHENIVLLGDSAHTAHFSIGSGTKLAMEDSIALARAVEQYGDDVEAAQHEYELGRKPAVENFQAAAEESQTYFETIRHYLHLEPKQFTFYLLTRSGRVAYDDLRLRDPQFVAGIDAWFAAKATDSRADDACLVVAPPPLLTPVALRGLSLPNRVVLSPPPTYSATGGMPNDVHVAQLQRRAAAGAGLVITETAAVSSEGRITPGDVGMDCPEQQEAWARIVDSIHASFSARVGIQLGHAGRRGSTRRRREGLDQPLREGNWPLLSASPLPYTPHSQIPKEMDRADMDKVRDEFVRAARMAQEAGFDLLQLHFAHGYLLASFISPLTNMRSDDYGGSREKRLRFPLEVFDAVRAVWPEHKPISVAISAADWVEGGFDVADAVVLAKVLKEHGCDLIMPLAGQTTPEFQPLYGPGFLTGLSDRVRNEAAIATMTTGHITTAGQVNTILAAGRADLCILDTPHLDEGGQS